MGGLGRGEIRPDRAAELARDRRSSDRHRGPGGRETRAPIPSRSTTHVPRRQRPDPNGPSPRSCRDPIMPRCTTDGAGGQPDHRLRQNTLSTEVLSTNVLTAHDPHAARGTAAERSSEGGITVPAAASRWAAWVPWNCPYAAAGGDPSGASRRATIYRGAEPRRGSNERRTEHDGQECGPGRREA